MRKIKATIKTGTGVELTIESDPRTVQEVIADVHRREEQRVLLRKTVLQRREFMQKRLKEFIALRNKSAHAPSKDSKKPKTMTKLLFEMIKQGVFTEPKTIRDVQNVLHQKGYLLPVTSVSPLLLRAVRQGMLKRTLNDKGTWLYHAGEKHDG